MLSLHLVWGTLMGLDTRIMIKATNNIQTGSFSAKLTTCADHL